LTKGQALAIGARGLQIPQSGLRPESFEYLRAGGKPVPSLPVTLAFYADGTRHIVDGRHRITLARERGEQTIVGRMIGYGPRLGIVWRHSGRFPI
jgi:hypothetical protein